MKYIFQIIIIVFAFSLLYSKEKLKFSADSAKSSKNNDVISKVFQDNVKIIDDVRILYTNNATQYPDSNKVILLGDVKMYENQDSLICEKLILYKNDIEMYEASGNVELYKQGKTIKAQNLNYYIDEQIIRASNNIIMEDSLRKIQGDSLYVAYKNDKIDSVIVTSNAKIVNSKSISTKNNPSMTLYQDYIQSNRLIALFLENDDIDYMLLDGMATVDINVVQDSIFKGINNVSGDTIRVFFSKNSINQMHVSGGVIGEFIPYKEYKKINSNINYKADIIKYYPLDEISILTNNAQIIYLDNYLEGGEIQVNFKNNIIESKVKDDILPSTYKEGSSPTYGDYMLFNLETELGNVLNGYQEIDLGLFKGDNFISNSKEDVYINNAIFTSCDNPEPHYYIRSKQMKVINKNNRIIAKPLIMHIQDFPAFTVPFAVLPNSTKKRKSGYIMPSFGHSSDLGTYMKDLGYYYAPNDYLDIETYLDFYDRAKVTIDSHLRYHKNYGNSWYNYKYKGYLDIDNYITKLSNEDDDFTNLNDDGYKSYLVIFDHTQYFNLNHYLDFRFETTYDELDDIDYITNAEIYESDYQNLMSYYIQNSNLTYSNQLGNHTISIYTYENNNQAYKSTTPIANQEKSYHIFQLPKYTYNYNNPSLFGINDRWYSSIFLKINSLFNEGQYEKKKEAIEVSSADGEYVWSNDDKVSYIQPYMTHRISFGNSFNIFNYIKLTPNISYNEEWALQQKEETSIFSFSDYLSHRISNLNFIDDYNIIGRKGNGNVSVNMNTTLYGHYPISKKENVKFKHIISPTINHSYSTETKFIKGNSTSFDNHNLIKAIINDFSAITSFSLQNIFSIESLDENGKRNTRKILRYNVNSLAYNWKTRLFGNLSSTIGIKDKNEREFLTIIMIHSLYEDDNINKFRDKPKLTSLSTSFSKSFNFNLYGQRFDNDTNNEESEFEEYNDNSSQQHNHLHNSHSQNTSNDNIWDSSLNFSLTAKYDLVNKWVVDYSNLGVDFNIKLTKEWKMNNNIVLNLVEKKLMFYELEFKRSLHCWDFSFIMRPIGFNKGFSLKINLSKPSLQSMKITQSTRKFHY